MADETMEEHKSFRGIWKSLLYWEKPFCLFIFSKKETLKKNIRTRDFEIASREGVHFDICLRDSVFKYDVVCVNVDPTKSLHRHAHKVRINKDNCGSLPLLNVCQVNFEYWKKFSISVWKKGEENRSMFYLLVSIKQPQQTYKHQVLKPLF